MRRAVLLLLLLLVSVGLAGCTSERSQEPEKTKSNYQERLKKLKLPKAPPGQ